ncbi:uncharacterized protein L969DRAFT_342986 [Mixia osmundae IAM 14324]|uniref:Uncharacterized protein n=1 Tax=Mixia osmundae (strain CBS 9802 / IAM 14324 / JCM 22182 / KY 12970) TaxID=764103 RepID=G7E5Y4_MIXOS|nr:uncharacterized protein L969DRAFT_342986 [Mixia osmundae IAM 14324]KEI40605.1 hypothetical protein L969DRAFT_342986 [Mixia osmundae IAM 14324]GAA98244.1 hypothetical protein E5Q_04927 [Mixia osmundae IAM 14324]
MEGLDGAEDISDVNELRFRIAALEARLKDVRAEEIQAQTNSSTLRTAQNLDEFGHSDFITFVNVKDENNLSLDEQRQRGWLHYFWHRYNFSTFVHRPRLHQWLSYEEVGKPRIFRDINERTTSRFELFFDLLFVGLVHQLAEATAEQPNGYGLARFVLTFCPAYSIWGDMRDFINQFGNDDMLQRLYIIWTMILLVGYQVNAGSANLQPEGEIGEELARQSHRAIQYALAFVVVAKASRIAVISAYAKYLPLSRRAMMINSLVTLFLLVSYLVAIWLPITGIYALVIVAILGEYALKISALMILRFISTLTSRRRKAKDAEAVPQDNTQNSSSASPHEEKLEGYVTPVKMLTASTTLQRYPAVAIEHHIERLACFTIIVLGELVVNILFRTESPPGLNSETGRSVLGLMVAFNLNWIYSESEVCHHYVHAVRRNWLTSFLYTTLHLPLSLALLLASAAMARLVEAEHSEEVPRAIYFFQSSGFGLAVILMGCIGFLHKPTHSHRRRGLLIAFRLAVGTVSCFIPFAKDTISPLQLQGINVSLTSLIIILEAVSKLQRVGPDAHVRPTAPVKAKPYM